MKLYCELVLSVCLYVSVVFPQDLLENGLAAKNFAMLGLGDIVIPGIFIALLLRFDLRYFVVCYIDTINCSFCALLILVSLCVKS